MRTIVLGRRRRTHSWTQVTLSSYSYIQCLCSLLYEYSGRLYHLWIPLLKVPRHYPLYFARAVYHIPSEFVIVRACFNNSLSLSFESTEISERKSTISSAFHLERARNNSEKRAPGSTGSSDDGKYASSVFGGTDKASVDVR